jgi:hypothetical protein
MQIAVTRITGKALVILAVLSTTGGSMQASGGDAALLALEDDWRRSANAVVQDEARRVGITPLPDRTVLTLLQGAGGTLASMPAGGGSHLLYVSRAAHRLKPGLYQAVATSTGIARLFYFDPQLGRVAATLRVPPGDPAAFHTPLGDDMCRNAPNLIMEFCQTFVACAAYGFFC